MTRACVLEMDWDELEHHLTWVNDQRKAEASAIRDAQRKKS